MCESSERSYARGNWEAAETLFEKLLVAGTPLPEIAPKLIPCLLNAHAELPPRSAQRIESLLQQLTTTGHATLAQELRQQHAARLAPPRKSWWKVW